MKKKIIIFIYLILTTMYIFASNNKELIPKEKEDRMKNESHETAVFAGGCFWGVEAVFESLEGVYNVQSGYSGGEAETASYKIVGTGDTGHAEAVKLDFDPSVISYKELLDVFFMVAHNPTELNFQGPDYGTEYRSEVFYLNESQKQEVNEYITDLNEKKVYKDPVVTVVNPLKEFYNAEEYHQDFLRLNPTHPYIVYWDMPKLNQLKKMYPNLITK